MEPEAVVEPVAPVVEPVVAETPAEPAPSLADAITAGIELAPERGPAKDPVDDPAAEPEGDEGAQAGADKKDDDAEQPAKAGDKEPENKDGKKDADHVNDPIPKELSERTRERITSLASMVKEKDAIIENQGNLVSAVMQTGASAEQFAGIIGYLRNLNSTDPKNLEQCLKDMDNMRENIAMRLGRPVEGVDFLKDHKDLAEAVAYGQITREHAQELAISRRRRDIEQASAESARTTTTQAAAEQAAAVTDLNELGDFLKQTDPDYAAKYQQIESTVKSLSQHPPKQWKAKFMEAYRAAKVTRAAPVVPSGDGTQMERDPQTGRFVPVRQGQPLRPGAPAGGGSDAKTAPKSFREAIDAGLAAATR